MPTNRRVTFADVRRIALALPQVQETAYATTSRAFKVKGKLFARFGPPIGDWWGVPARDGFKGPPNLDPKVAADVLMIRWTQDREAILKMHPESVFLTPHYEGGSTVLVHVHAWKPELLDELAELLEDAWREAAPRRIVAERDAARPSDQ